MEKYIEKGFGWRRNLDYLKVNFIMMLKKLKEYKSNIFFGLLQEIVYHLTMLFVFFTVLNNNFGDIIGWTLLDFMLFSFFCGLVSDFTGIIIWKEGLREWILKGILNNILTRPINTYLSYQFSKISNQAFIAVCVDILVFTGISLFFKFIPKNIYLSILILLLIFVNHIFIEEFTKALNFFSFGLSDFFYNLRDNLYETTVLYPAIFFFGFSLKNIFLFFSFFYVGLLLIPTIKGYHINNFAFYFGSLIIIDLFFVILTLVLWKYGLKKYEAFG